MPSEQDPNQTFACPNCAWRGPEDQLQNPFPDIPDLTERVAPGERVPAGECPECGALCHLVAEANPQGDPFTVVAKCLCGCDEHEIYHVHGSGAQAAAQTQGRHRRRAGQRHARTRSRHHRRIPRSL